MRTLLAAALISLSLVHCEIKTWHDNTRVASDDCVQSKTIFPKESDRVIFLHIPDNFNEIVLPKDGAIILERQSDNVKPTSPDLQNNCERIDLNGRKPSQAWFSADSWSNGEPTNVAKPHVYRIPCECDQVVIPVDPPTPPVDLEYADELVAEQIKIGDKVDDFNGFLETAIGQRMFLNSEAVRFEPGLCHPERYCGCHSFERFKKYTSLVCERDGANCPEAPCLEPIKPHGHCCPVCGSVLQFRIDDACEFNMTNMNEVGRKLQRFRNGKYVNQLHYFAGMVPRKDADHNFVQLVVAEVDGYSGISREFMQFLIKDGRFKVDQYRSVVYSGDPYVRGQTSAFTIIALTFVFVVSCFTILYWHYVREPKYDQWIPIARLNVLRKSIAFARFENRHGDDDNNTINVDIKYETDESDAKNGNDFNNPMYAAAMEAAGDGGEASGAVPFEQAVEVDEAGSSANDINLVDISLDAIAE